MANPNPSPETRFGGERGNMPAGGKSSKQRKAEIQAAEDAAELRARMLSIIKENTSGDDNALLDMLNSDLLRLFKDSEDRAHGTPKQAVDHTSSDGSMTPPSAFIIEGVKPDERTED